LKKKSRIAGYIITSFTQNRASAAHHKKKHQPSQWKKTVEKKAVSILEQ
jgi:hypothetical protein